MVQDNNNRPDNIQNIVEQQYRLMVEQLNEGILVIDTQGRITFVNPQMVEMLGYSIEEVIDRTFHSFTEENLRDFIDTKLKQRLQGLNDVYEMPLLTKDNRQIFVSISASPLRDEFGNHQGSFAVISDISERKQMEAALAQAKEAAEAASQAKSDFLANMSHEIRTPISTLIGAAQILLSTELTDEQKEYVSMIYHSADVLLALINNILDFSKIEADQLNLEKIDFDLYNLLDEVLDFLRLNAGEKGLKLNCLVSPLVPRYINGDPLRIRQVLLNLVNNAVKFTDIGSVFIRVSIFKESGPVIILKFDVVDTGIGIAAETRRRLFAPFIQADASTTRRFGGSGLGLAISKNLVEKMGGEIGCESELGTGSTFWFTLPVTARIGAEEPFHRQQEKDLPRKIAKRQTRVKPVLVAEDNPDLQSLIKAQLERLGYTAEFAPDGIKAVYCFTTREYSAILMDIHMPVMDGYRSSTIIRDVERVRGGHIPIIALTANAMGGDIHKCFKAGMDDYLSKPVLLEELNAVLIKWVPDRQELSADLSSDSTNVFDKGKPVMGEEKSGGIDWNVLGGYVPKGEETAFLPRIIEEYLTNSRERISSLKKALETRDLSLLKKTVHSFSSASAYLGARHLCNLLKVLEMNTIQDGFSSSRQILTEIELEFARIQSELTETRI